MCASRRVSACGVIGRGAMTPPGGDGGRAMPEDCKGVSSKVGPRSPKDLGNLLFCARARNRRRCSSRPRIHGGWGRLGPETRAGGVLSPAGTQRASYWLGWFGGSSRWLLSENLKNNSNFNSFWRRWDSNRRYGFRYARFFNGLLASERLRRRPAGVALERGCDVFDDLFWGHFSER